MFVVLIIDATLYMRCFLLPLNYIKKDLIFLLICLLTGSHAFFHSCSAFHFFCSFNVIIHAGIHNLFHLSSFNIHLCIHYKTS